ncbi:hypothetical protein MKUB_29140 [Mycobacterium kubicae]|uniref:Helix-turn-helix domain-containing protein n=1 Tax=Mycobacterium kubicae TaxID=120959 RepID=A0AAP9V097_9MYCO|nr:helix-turn-helix domain-containing protein [Mycobacterium kubicae]MCV7097793.1 helix-turn-helix domain-containing protein [Mycobacterium kubicae]ORW03313.1 hypothetical protein AWC13_02500 [Mycobacterium kubicae]QNI10198.1 helix-turn-helix domain-containing protein [Mycobacterium kubicae]QNI11684.1 helix-turn-helix domain-containing protein [Mycobacterium kubicae]QNI12377.1 helix-turn-helix domain-containing protein [Mycobacterium kubicae]
MIQRLAGVYLDAYDGAFVVEALDRLAQLTAGPTPARLESVTAKLRRAVRHSAEPPAQPPVPDSVAEQQHSAQPPETTASVRALQRDSVHAGPHVTGTMGTGQAARLLGISANGVRDLARRGRLPASRTGTRWQFDAAAVTAFSQRRAAAQGR